MADKNKNGIPDDKELGPSNNIFAPNRPKGAVYKPSVYAPDAEGLPGFFNQLNNWGIDTERNIGNFLGSIGEWATGSPRTPGGGVGDSMWGSAPQKRNDMSWMDDLLGNVGRATDIVMGGAQQQGPQIGNTELPSFMDYLRQAMDQVGGVGRVSYDPLRQDARGRSTEYDARIAAMYNQLQNSMRDDGKQLQGTFQGAIDDTAARGADTQQQIQAASNAADDRNLEVLRNLGIEEAQGNIVNEGRDLNTQTADAVADAAARSQISGDALQRNQTSAATHNTNLVGAAGLEGNLQRARIQSELSSLLAQYDMQEQEANRQAQQQSFAQSLGLANSMYEDAWRKQGYNDDMTKWLWEQQQAAMQPGRTDPMQYSMNFISQLQQQFPDLDPELLIKMLGPAASVGKLAN